MAAEQDAEVARRYKKIWLTVDACKAELERLFYRVLTASSIAADVATLKDTYRAIIRAEGGYPPRKHR